jgi:hypothetical protein
VLVKRKLEKVNQNADSSGELAVNESWAKAALERRTPNGCNL